MISGHINESLTETSSDFYQDCCIATRRQRWGLDIDRAKSEWAPSPHWLVGAGYSGGICSSRTWESKPFLTTTRKTHTGNYEFWIQRTPAGAQVQFRYLFVQGEN